MSEMAITADHLIVIGKGKLIRDESVTDFVESSSHKAVRVRSPQMDRLRELVAAAGGSVHPVEDGAVNVLNLDASAVGELAASNGVVLHELTPMRASLEEAFMELTRDSVEYHAEGKVA
jgi:ABC-2 type transport system ATP-binding protein